MTKSAEVEQIIIRMRNEQCSIKEIARAVDCSYQFVQRKCKKLEVDGIVNFASINGHKRKVIPKKKVVKQARKMGCCCDYPGCKDEAEYTFSLVPLCPFHYEAVSDEADAHYQDDTDRREAPRRHWERIKKRSAELWANQRASISTQTRSAMSLLSSKQRKKTKKPRQ